MIFSVAVLVAYISKQFTLEEGDIIATGTPSGISPIRSGDSVDVEVEGIGVLTNPVVSEKA
jgi:2-keto-4-pentenoate hydratase/2-oxohepta-3-ene-1,7-dioic acid hydratase in catechol pathway